MPIFTLVTNISQDKITPKVLASASELISELFDVTEQDVLISIKTGVQMIWGTQTGNYALGTVQNNDPIQAEDTKNLAPAVFEFVEEHLGIPQNRMYLGFITLNSENIAFGGNIYTTMTDE